MMNVHQFGSPAPTACWCRAKVAATWMACAVVSLAAAVANAQVPAVHYRFSGDMAPGAVGSAQLQRGGPLPGYFQPVEIAAPSGVEISLATQGGFDQPAPAPLLAGMQIGPVYRLKVTRIPFHEGEEVFPSIELIDRLYPPLGMERRFPIVVEITSDDLELALKGNFVTRVIYLEDPDQALPAAEANGQISYEAGAGEDPLQMADVLGRPVAILRLGGRVPVETDLDEQQRALFAPPVLKLARPAQQRHSQPQPTEVPPPCVSDSDADSSPIASSSKTSPPARGTKSHQTIAGRT